MLINPTNVQFYKKKNRLKLKHILKKYFLHTVTKKNFYLIGGTNGKGTTSNVFQELLFSKTRKVGILTSPHLCYMNERIRINKIPISNDEIQRITTKYLDIFIKYRLSYYEIIFFIALEYFYSNKVEFIVLEIGIGGQFDACNIVNPKISLLTNVAYDHTNVLGKSLEEIAKTKAHIVRKNRYLIIGYWIPKNIQKIIKKVVLKEKGKLFILNKTLGKFYELLFLSKYKFIPYHFKYNISLAIYAIMKSKLVTKKSIMKKLNNYIQIPWGRYNHFIYKKNKIIIDGAHNFHAIEALINNIKQKNLIVFFASKKDKDFSISLNFLTSHPSIKTIYLCAFNNDNCIIWSKSNNSMCTILNNEWKIKLRQILQTNEINNFLFCGSLYFVSEVFSFFSLAKETTKPFLLKPTNLFIQIDKRIKE